MEKYRTAPLGERAIFSGGDDYELCFTVPPEKAALLEAIGKRLGIRLSRVGRIKEGEGLVVVDEANNAKRIRAAGYEHFR